MARLKWAKNFEEADDFLFVHIHQRICNQFNARFFPRFVSRMTEIDQDTTMTDPPSKTLPQKQKTTKGHEITTKTIRTSPFSYARLELMSESTSDINLDNLTVRSYIMAALTQFLGLSGSAISVDILKVEGREAWIRVQREDLSPVLAALGGWVGGSGVDRIGRVGWKVKSSGNWLSSLVGENEVEKIWSG